MVNPVVAGTLNWIKELLELGFENKEIVGYLIDVSLLSIEDIKGEKYKETREDFFKNNPDYKERVLLVLSESTQEEKRFKPVSNLKTQCRLFSHREKSKSLSKHRYKPYEKFFKPGEPQDQGQIQSDNNLEGIQKQLSELNLKTPANQ